MVMPGDNTEMMVELIAPHRDGRRPALRDPRRWPHRRRRPRHQDPQVAGTSAAMASQQRTEDPDPAQGLRPRDHRPVDEEDRRDGRADAGQGPGPGARCPRRSAGSASCARRTSTRTPASTSRCGSTSVSSTSSSPPARRSSRSSASTSPRVSTSRSRSRPRRPLFPDGRRRRAHAPRGRRAPLGPLSPCSLAALGRVFDPDSSGGRTVARRLALLG